MTEQQVAIAGPLLLPVWLELSGLVLLTFGLSVPRRVPVASVVPQQAPPAIEPVPVKEPEFEPKPVEISEPEPVAPVKAKISTRAKPKAKAERKARTLKPRASFPPLRLAANDN